VFGFNDASNPSPAGIPGGDGVFRVSNVPNASGVFGVNDLGAKEVLRYRGRKKRFMLFSQNFDEIHCTIRRLTALDHPGSPGSP